MRAAEVMIKDPIVVAAGATSSEVAALMRIKNISVVPVVDNPKDRRYLGTISDRDIVTECVGQGHDPSDCAVQDHARTDMAERADLDTSPEDGALLHHRRGVHRHPALPSWIMALNSASAQRSSPTKA